MKKAEITDRRYPIGKFEYGQKYKIDDTRKHIRYLSRFPDDLKKTVKKLDREELDTPYRKGGWTVRQVVHHLADSHLNAYIRTKLAVTEQTPIIKPYEEQLWAETEDGKRGSVKMSLKLIAALHRRWMEFLESLSEDDLERGYFHPASGRVMLMQEVIALYVWHSQHHLAHIQLVANGGAEKIAKPVKAEKAKAEKAASTKAEASAAKRGSVSTTRSNIKRAVASPTDEGSTGKKRVRRTKEQLAADQAAEAAAKEAKAAAKAAKQAAAAAEKAARPPVDRAAIMAKARAARAFNTTAAAAAPKERKSAAKPAKSAQVAESGKRVRRTQEQIAAEKAAEVAAKASAKETKAAASAAQKAAEKATKPPVDRAAIMAKARAARQANLAAAAADQQAKPTTPKEKKAPAPAAPAIDPGKRPRRTQEQIAADKAAAVEAKAAAKLEKKAMAKAAKKSGDGPKRAGMSAEHMARIREARMAKRAADIAAGLIPPPKPKVERDPNAPKLSRAEILEKARASRKANLVAKKAEADKA